MLHCCVGYYPNGDIVVNTVCDENLESDIEYNRTFRPGRFYFVDGKYVCGGVCIESLKNEIISKVEDYIKKKSIKAASADSAPYM